MVSLQYTFFISGPSDATAEKLQQEAALVIKQVTTKNEELSIVYNNELNATKASYLKNLTYTELKRRLRIEGDFCIFIQDQEGNIISINNSYRGIGSPSIQIDGVPCDLS